MIDLHGVVLLEIMWENNKISDDAGVIVIVVVLVVKMQTMT